MKMGFSMVVPTDLLMADPMVAWMDEWMDDWMAALKDIQMAE
jgi:hypothetical protein